MSEPGKVETQMSDDATAPQEPDDDDLKALLAKRQHARPNKVTWVLLVLLILAIGFTMGSCMQKAANGLSRSAPGQPGAPELPPVTSEQPGIAPDSAGESGPDSGGFAPPAGGFGPPGDVTVGTVESIDGSTMTIATRDGSTVMVTVPEGTPVTSQVEVPLADLPVGSDVVVRGATGADGTVTADSVSEGGFGGFPGGGRRNAPAP